MKVVNTKGAQKATQVKSYPENTRGMMGFAFKDKSSVIDISPEVVNNARSYQGSSLRLGAISPAPIFFGHRK